MTTLTRVTKFVDEYGGLWDSEEQYETQASHTGMLEGVSSSLPNDLIGMTINAIEANLPAIVKYANAKKRYEASLKPKKLKPAAQVPTARKTNGKRKA